MLKGIVTGASGFIGQQVLRSFKEAGYKVGALDLFNPDIEGIPFRKANIVSKKEVNDAFSCFKGQFGGLDFVVHLAACFNYSKPASMMEAINVQGADNVAYAAINNRARYFINMGAVAEYREGAGLEDKIKENTPLEPICNYGKTKLMAGELLFVNYHKKGDLALTHFRACMVYGHYQQGTYVDGNFNMIRNNRVILMPSRKIKNSYVHTKNIARAFLHALQNPDKVFRKDARELNHAAYNLGEDEVKTETEVSKFLAKIIPGKTFRIVLPIIPSGVLENTARLAEFVESFVKNRTSLPVDVAKHARYSHNLDTSKFKATGFEYVDTLEEGLSDVVDWYKQNVWKEE